MSGYIRRFPFIPLTISLVLGIILGNSVSLPPSCWLQVFLVLLILCIFLNSRIDGRVISKLKSLLILLAVLSLGAYRISDELPQFDVTHFSHYLKDDCIVFGRVLKVQQKKCIVRVFSVDDKRGLNGRLLVRAGFEFPGELVHDIIAFRGNPDVLKGPRNPTHFNARRYYFGKGIFHQIFIANVNDHWILKRDWRRLFRGHVSEWREKVSGKLSVNLGKGETFGLVNAMLLGDKSDLQEELRQAYTHAGVAHLLAISGLHVGIIYLILQRLFFFLPVHLHILRWVKAFFIISGIWTFAFFSGQAVPVIRAATMFAVFQIGSLLQKRNYNLNNLAFVAFLLLVMSPWALWDIGFQLSFLAVTGILIGYPVIFGWIKRKNYFIRNAWSLVAVSISAQILIFPILLFHFHEFPTLFWLSSALLIPLTTVLIGASLVLVVVPSQGLLSVIVGQTVDQIGQLMHATVRFVKELPFSLISGIWVEGFGIAILCCLSIVILILLHFPTRQVFILSICLLAGYQISRDINNWMATSANMAVYYVKDKSLINIFIGRQCFEWNPYALSARELSFITSGLKEKFRTNYTIDLKLNPHPIFYKHPIIAVNDQTILLLDENYSAWHPRVKVDWVVLQGNTPLRADKITQLEDAFFIIDSSNDWVHAKKYEQALHANGSRFHNVLAGGGILKKL